MILIACRESIKDGVVHSEVVWQHKATAKNEDTRKALTELVETYDREEIKTFKFYSCSDITSFFTSKYSLY